MICLDANLTKVGAISFSTRVIENINLADNLRKAEITSQLWNLPFLAGMTNTADALMVIIIYNNNNNNNIIIYLQL